MKSGNLIVAMIALCWTSMSIAGVTEDYYANLKRSMARLGYTEAFSNRYNSLGEGQTYTYTYTASPGKYYFSAVCDDDCGDIDIYLYDASGRLLSSDTDDDDQPLVGWNFSYASRVSIKVKMISCSDEPCYYRLGGFR